MPQSLAASNAGWQRGLFSCMPFEDTLLIEGQLIPIACVTGRLAPLPPTPGSALGAHKSYGALWLSRGAGNPFLQGTSSCRGA